MTFVFNELQMTKTEILMIVREHMADCSGVSERDLDDHSERIAFRLAPKFAALIEENKRLRGILACAEIELISYLDQYTGKFGDECIRKLMAPNVEITGSGQVHRPESSDRRERG